MNSPTTQSPASKYMLVINASGRQESSASRKHSTTHAQALAEQLGLEIRYRDLAVTDLPFVNDLMIQAYFIPEDQRTEEMKAALLCSDALVDELRDAERLIIGVPVYNFSVPASMKAWADQVARLGVTFEYRDGAPVGMLKNRKTHVFVASGGTTIGSQRDYATPWLRTFLNFIGISDIEFLAAEMSQ